MSNNIFYDPYNEIRCDRFALEKLVKESEAKDQRIAELEEQLANSIRPKFPRQEHICGFAFGEIREYIVVAYLDNDITLCENIETSELEWCDNNFLVRTFEEAQAKLKELGESMITKERLEELIKQGATIWGVYDYSYSYDKPNKKVESIDLDGFYNYYKDIDEFIMYQGDYSELFETEQEAEWHKEFGCILKIERLWFPTWESVYNDLKDYKDGDFYILDNDHFSFVYNKCYITPQLFLYTRNEKFNWNANKENYYEACKLAKKIFLGERE